MTLYLQNTLAGVLGAVLSNLRPAPTVVLGSPGTGAGPQVAVYGGDTQILAQGSEYPSSQPKPVEMQERIAVQSAHTATTPYPLQQPPVQGSVQVRLVFDPGGLEEYGLLLAKEDFRVEETAPSVTIQADLGAATLLQVSYSYYSTVTTLAFRQALYLEMISPDVALREQLSALCGAILLTEHDVLVEQSNRLAASNVHTAGSYMSQVSVGRITWIGSSVVSSDVGPSLRMHFDVNGQIRNMRTGALNTSIIESIRSAGTKAGKGIHVVPELG